MVLPDPVHRVVHVPEAQRSAPLACFGAGKAHAHLPRIQDEQYWALFLSRHLSAVVTYLSINNYFTSSLAASFHHLLSLRPMTVLGWRAFFLSSWTKAIQWSEQQEVLNERYC